ncbi:MAG: hypothetical protein L0215_04900 [Gemmataceae bacterium]|nr:hypothetical protein [Gemmataceae bacterium]
MRAIWILFILGLISALTVPAMAQQKQANSIFTGVDPREIKTVPYDMSKALQPYNMSRSFHKAPTANPFNLSNFFRKMTLGAWPPLVAQTPVLDQKNNPFQPNPILGKNPFSLPPKKK